MSNKKTSKKTKKKSSQVSKSKLVKIFLLIFLFAFIASGLSYFIMKNENTNKSIKNDILKTEKTLPKKQDKEINEYFDKLETPKEKFEEQTEELKKDYEEVIKELPKKSIEKTEVKKEIKKETKKIEVIKQTQKKQIITKTSRDKYTHNKKDKAVIAIVIDDVSSSRQKKAILDIGYNVTMAFLPPQEGHSNSAKIAQNQKVHMIHIPMQASPKFKSTEKITLTIDDSYKRIESIIKNLRKLYPKAVYINNHTGSVFTQNDDAMDKLFKALKKYDFVFVDSRTTAKSVAKKYALKYNMPYIVRNTFLDNEKDYTYIQNQLKKAIKIAKKRGYAIAIGHPHSLTLKVLKESKHLLKDVQPIFINKLPYL